MNTKAKAVRARARGDSVRHLFRDALINFSTGVHILPEKDQLAIIRRVRTFDDFAAESEHDLGSFTHNGRTICWQLDYLDAVLRIPRHAAGDRAQTPRVVCVMLAEERRPARPYKT